MTTNSERAEWALEALDTFGHRTGQLLAIDRFFTTDFTEDVDLEGLGLEVLGDFLTDLFHAIGGPTSAVWAEAQIRAWANYAEEDDEEGTD